MRRDKGWSRALCGVDGAVANVFITRNGGIGESLNAGRRRFCLCCKGYNRGISKLLRVV